MSILNKGIVLRTYIPKKQKLLILDSKLGKIEVIPKNYNSAIKVPNGSYINYSLIKWNLNYKIFDINILDVPFYWAHENLLFFHHVLELCFYFLPLDCPLDSVNIDELDESSEVFELVIMLYLSPEFFSTKLLKKLFICHFFSKIGVYPNNILDYGAKIFDLISSPLHSKFDIENEKVLNIKLQSWILECINIHFNGYRLKTVDFLKELS